MHNRKKISATRAAVISVNTSFSREITAQNLIAIFKSNAPVSQWQSHIGVFFSELPDSVLQGFMQENMISVAMLKHVYSLLPSVFHSKKFEAFIK